MVGGKSARTKDCLGRCIRRPSHSGDHVVCRQPLASASALASKCLVMALYVEVWLCLACSHGRFACREFVGWIAKYLCQARGSVSGTARILLGRRLTPSGPRELVL